MAASADGRVIAADLFLGALEGRPGARRVDFFGALRHIRQHAHVAGQHFQKSAGHGQIPPLAARDIVQHTASQLAQQGRVAGQNPHVAVLAGHLHLGRLLAHQQALGRGHFQFERVRHGQAFFSASALSSTSSMVPTM